MTFTIEGREVIVLGDTTTHGGKVVTASSGTTYMGAPIARVGDMVHCPKCKGTFPIAEGAPLAFDLGNNIACHGDKTACGAALISGQAGRRVSGAYPPPDEGFANTVDPVPTSWVAEGLEDAIPVAKQFSAEILCELIAGVTASKQVQDQVAEAYRLTLETNSEYVGWIVETSPGVYEIPELHTSGRELDANVPPAPANAIGIFHTHPPRGEPSFTRHDRNSAKYRVGIFEMVKTSTRIVFQDRSGNNIICDPNQGGPRICKRSGDDNPKEHNESPCR